MEKSKRSRSYFSDLLQSDADRATRKALVELLEQKGLYDRIEKASATTDLAELKQLNELLKLFQPQLKFGALIQGHMKNLNWSQEKLAVESALTQSMISYAVLSKPDRTIGRHEINRIAWAVAKGYEELHGKDAPIGLGINYLDLMLNELLEAAGMPAIHGGSFDQQLNKILSRKKIVVGWFPWGGVAEPTTVDNIFRGDSYKIMERITRLLGLKVQYEQIGLDEITKSLIERKVDVVAPFLALPSRLLEIDTTRQINGYSCGVNAVLRKEHMGRLGKNPQLPSLHFSHREDINWSLMELVYVEGGTPEVLKNILIGEESVVTKEVKNFQEGITLITEKSVTDRGLIRCFVADAVSCADLGNRHDGLAKLFDHSEIKLPLVIGVHPLEPTLLDVINHCLYIMENDSNKNGENFFKRNCKNFESLNNFPLH